jgi:hypothetical protein
VSNFALRRATSDWILRLTPDDRLDELAFERMANILNGAAASSTVGFLMQSELGGGQESEIRLFRNDAQILYEGRAMERVAPSIGRLGGLILDSKIAFRGKCHGNGDGHVNGNGNMKRVLALLHQDLAESASVPETLYRLGRAHARTGNTFHAECYLNEFLQRGGEAHPDFERGARLLIATYLRIGDPLRAQEWESKLNRNGRRNFQ